MTNLYNYWVFGKTNGMPRHYRNNIVKNLDLTNIFCLSSGSLYVRIYCVSKHFDGLYISWSYQHWSVLYFLYVGPLSSLESSTDDFEEAFDDSSGRQSRRVESKRTSRCQRSRASTRLRNESSQTKECKYSQSCHFLPFYCETGFEAASWPDWILCSFSFLT